MIFSYYGGGGGDGLSVFWIIVIIVAVIVVVILCVVCWQSDSLSTEKSDEGSKYSRQISYSGSIECYLCLKKVSNDVWDSGLHRRQCAYTNKEKLLTFPTPFGGSLDCGKCKERFRLWPAMGMYFYCDICNSKQDSNGKNRLNCFQCDYDICVSCAHIGKSNRDQIHDERDMLHRDNLFNPDDLTVPSDIYVTKEIRDNLLEKIQNLKIFAKEEEKKNFKPNITYGRYFEQEVFLPKEQQQDLKIASSTSPLPYSVSPMPSYLPNKTDNSPTAPVNISHLPNNPSPLPYSLSQVPEYSQNDIAIESAASCPKSQLPYSINPGQTPQMSQQSNNTVPNVQVHSSPWVLPPNTSDILPIAPSAPSESPQFILPSYSDATK